MPIAFLVIRQRLMNAALQIVKHTFIISMYSKPNVMHLRIITLSSHTPPQFNSNMHLYHSQAFIPNVVKATSFLALAPLLTPIQIENIPVFFDTVATEDMFINRSPQHLRSKVCTEKSGPAFLINCVQVHYTRHEPPELILGTNGHETIIMSFNS